MCGDNKLEISVQKYGRGGKKDRGRGGEKVT